MNKYDLLLVVAISVVVILSLTTMYNGYVNCHEQGGEYVRGFLSMVCVK